MNESVLTWGAAALALFWSVGAYNRLVRLRAAALQTYAVLDSHLVRHSELLAVCLTPAAPALSASKVGEPQDSAAARWAGLAGAANQFATALGAARTRPLEGRAVAALASALTVLTMAWRRLLEECHDLAGEPIPESIQARWTLLTSQTDAARDAFNAAVADYNSAIGAFPAVLLAWLFGMKPAQPL
jgi:LemA protein